MIYLEFEVLEMLCTFRLVLKGKASRERPELTNQNLGKDCSKQSVTEDEISGPLNRGGIASLILLKWLFEILQTSGRW